MAFWQARDFLFCGLCGTLLTFDSVRCATCPLCGFKRKAKEIEGKETKYTVTAEDIRRELKLEPFVILDSALELKDIAVERPLAREPCQKCQKMEVRYHTEQTRSADEGQTVFYDCGACGYTWKD